FITGFQSYGYIRGTIAPEAIIDSGFFFYFSAITILIAGTLFCMWLGERITDKGIGNGISMLIMIGIVSRSPAAIIAEAMDKQVCGALILILEVMALISANVCVIILTQATPITPIQYAKQYTG